VAALAGRAASGVPAMFALLLLGALPQLARAQTEPPTPVTVERERPARDPLEGVRSRRSDRDSSHVRADRSRLAARQSAAGAGELEPRFLAYRRLLSDVAADKDSVARAADARERASILVSVNDLGQLERELDLMERLLDSQRTRLGVLQRDFAGRQRTELDVLVTGGAVAGRVD